MSALPETLRTHAWGLSVQGRFPLSWRCEGGSGSSTARRVWGDQIGQALYRIQVVNGELALIDLRDRDRILQRWPNDPLYSSPWGGDGGARLMRIAEMHEADEFNADLRERMAAHVAS